ncbi:uncharacterized protein L201_001376 [Kwoniella dendrophila CBS 6074]|uniref:RNA-binding protein VTS1 n=1 Tax=Kwoniella dendrophila CBS 6074 TaxID=1295534 RepID=A0AAX4JP25_9TREE
MASSTLRPHRSPSPSPVPSPTINPSNPAKLTRQSLGPPSTTQGAQSKGFSGLGIASSSPSPSGPTTHPRHVSSAALMNSSSNGSGRESSYSPRPSLNGSGLMGNDLRAQQQQRAVSGGPGFTLGLPNGGRPSSEYIPSRENVRTPEAEQIDQWFKHLASWEATLEEMAAASTDQNFTEELGAIEQWFRVLSEAERTAALYSLLQHSTPVQIRFFLSVLHHMAQSDPMTALLSPAPSGPGLQAQMEQKLNAMNLKSPSAGGGSGFTGSPNANQYLAPEDQKAKNKQNRISAPGTLQPLDRWQSGLDQVIERGSSPGLESTGSSRGKSPTPEPRPKSTDFSGQANQPRRESSGFQRSPRLSAGGVGLGIGQPEGLPHSQSPMTSPFLNNGSWASMVNTPMVPGFIDPKMDNLTQALNMANLGLGNPNKIPLEDARKFRRATPGTTSRNVSGAYNDDGDMINPRSNQPGFNNTTSPLLGGGGLGGFARSPVLDQFNALGGLGLGADPNTLAGLGMNFANLPAVPGGLNAAQLMAMQQLQTAASFAQGGYGGGSPNLGVNNNQYNNNNHQSRNGNSNNRNNHNHPGRKSPMLGGNASAKNSPAVGSSGAGTSGGGGGAGGGAGVAGPDDVDQKVLEDTAGWLRVLRLHKYTPNFEKTSWKEMVEMNDQDLQDKGISAQGARTKFLKVFYNVRTKMDMPHPDGQEEYAPGGKDK